MIEEIIEYIDAYRDLEECKKELPDPYFIFEEADRLDKAKENFEECLSEFIENKLIDIHKDKVIDALKNKLKVIRDTLDFAWSQSPEGRDELRQIDELLEIEK